MSNERIDTVIIGAGQAGLSTAYHLTKLGKECVVLHADERVGDHWRRHWDSLRLYTPARYDNLPGMRLPAPKWTYPGKDEVADYLAAYAENFELPVRGGMKVDRVSRNGDGYLVHAGGKRFAAANVVVASGTFGKPYTPEVAAELDPRINQLHSSQYQRPDQLREGPVLVVGASHSGGDIAFEAATAAHPTVLCGRDTGQIPFRIDSKTARMVFPLLWFAWNHVLTMKTPVGRKARSHRNHGGPLLRVRQDDLQSAGVERVTSRVTGVSGGKPQLDDGRVLDVANVVWCTGFRHDLRWVEPVTLDDHGWPLERFGVADDAPGLYFVGLSFQRGFASMLVGGAGTDARYVARHIAARRESAGNLTEPAASAGR